MNNLIFSTKNIDDFISDVANEVVRKLSLVNNESSQETQEDLITVKKASLLLGLAESTVRSKVSRRELPFHKPKNSKKLLFSRKELMEYLKSGRVKTSDESYRDASIIIKGGSKNG